MSSRPRSPSSSDDETWCFVENTFSDMLDYAVPTGMRQSEVKSEMPVHGDAESPDRLISVEESALTPVETLGKKTGMAAEKKTPISPEEPKPKEKEYPAWESLISAHKQEQSIRFLDAKIVSAFAILFIVLYWIPLSIGTPGDVLLVIRMARLSAFRHHIENVPQVHNSLQSFESYNSIGSEIYARSYLSSPLQKQSYAVEKRGTNFIMKPEMSYVEIAPPTFLRFNPTCSKNNTHTSQISKVQLQVLPQIWNLERPVLPQILTLQLPAGDQCIKPVDSLEAPMRSRVYKASTTRTRSVLLLPSSSENQSSNLQNCTAPRSRLPTVSKAPKTESVLLLPSGSGKQSSDLQNYTASSPSDVEKVANISHVAQPSSSNSTKGELGAPCIKSKDVQVVLRAAAGEIHNLTQEANATKASLFKCNAARRVLEKELKKERSHRGLALADAENAREEIADMKKELITHTHLLEAAAAGALTAGGMCGIAAYAALPPSNESSCTDSSVATVNNANSCAEKSAFHEQMSTEQWKLRSAMMEKRHQEEMKRLSERLTANHASEMGTVVAQYENKLEELKAKYYALKLFSAYRSSKNDRSARTSSMKKAKQAKKDTKKRNKKQYKEKKGSW